MTQTAESPGPGGVFDPIRTGDLRGIMLAAPATDRGRWSLTTADPASEPVVVEVGTTPQARLSLEAEGRMLVELRRMPLGALGRTIPRYVRWVRAGDRAVLVTTALPGAPMSHDYRSWRHTARPAAVRRDLELAGTWLRALHEVTARGNGSVGWTNEVIEALRGRWDGDPGLEPALARLVVARDHLGDRPVASTVVHGDFWFDNVLVSDDGLTGVVGWASGKVTGCPLSDLARFALSYCLHLEETARPGHRVPGHPGLRRLGFAPGIRFGLLGRGWLHREVRRFLVDGLVGLGLPRWLWYDVALTGIAELAVSTPDDVGARHLELLASLPARPRELTPPIGATRRMDE